jgi:maltose alpha-D-glucosyltransferase / alpha-amylase
VSYTCNGRTPGTQALLDTIARSRRNRTTTGELIGRRRTRLGSAKELAELEIHLLRGEQSNTSLLVGDRFIVKVLRRLEPGISPDVEIGAALAGRIDHVPELLATLDIEPRDGGGARTVAMVQRFVPNEGDAWVHTLDELERYSERVVAEPPDTGRTIPDAEGSPLQLAGSPLSEVTHEVIGPYLDVAVLLGRRTAELHVALAEVTDDRAFTPEPFTSLYQRSLYQSMRNALRRGLLAARKGVSSVPDEDAQARILALAGREAEILERLRSLSTTRIETDRIRIHGDYHLGQVLWTGRDLVIIDFEGEPARPLGERRLKRSPLRDVAGMLRSFHYATASALGFQMERGAVVADSPQRAELERWLDYWYRWVSAGFVHGYLAVAAGHRFVPDDPEHTAILLDAFLLEKAVYELGYEMNNRPQWVHIPLAGITDVLDTGA